MLYFSRQKFFHVVKVILIFIIVIIAMTNVFEHWRIVPSKTVTFTNPEESEFERQILEDEARFVPGLGDSGEVAYLTGENNKRGQESVNTFAVNVYLSDRISYNRTLNDRRESACKQAMYDAELPSASVILIFYNEPYSVLLRTIWSVVNSCRRTNSWFQKANFKDSQGRVMTLGYPGQNSNSSFVYVKEIILVDDHSTLPALQGKLSYYVKTRLPNLVKLHRTSSRLGVTRARLAGARKAQSEVLIFLDSHCEAMVDWLRPLLQRIKEKRTAVVIPQIDVIGHSTFKYSYTGNQVCGFIFDGTFIWTNVPEREKKRRGSNIAPTRSPTMPGGLFAINRAYFWEMGAYDEEMKGWGGENLEISFRIWQCGGTIEFIPCSRVGHVFRTKGPPEYSKTYGINTVRMAEVWMDEYAVLFYMFQPGLMNSSKIGDLTHRKMLREKLQCKSFQWYLDNIYKEKFDPIRYAYGFGRNKFLEIDNVNMIVLMSTCRGKENEKKWTYNSSTEQIQYSDGLCLDAGNGRSYVFLKQCSSSPAQRWHIEYIKDDDLRTSNDSELNGSLGFLRLTHSPKTFEEKQYYKND